MQVFKRKLKVKGKLITEITVENNSGLKAELCTYGASIRGLYLPNNRGEQVLVTLAPKNYENYLLADDYHGKTVGRTAGRLAGASYTLDGVTSYLEKNHLVQRACKAANNRYRDVLIYRRDYELSEQDKLFQKKIYESKVEVASIKYN